MSEHESTPSSKPTLESLLRLKRHERPAPQFWVRFDRELRERALREFVRPEPIPLRLARRMLSRVTPWLTAGATAALALGFAVNGHFAPSRSIAQASISPVNTIEQPAAVSNTSVPVMVVEQPPAPAVATAQPSTLETATPTFVVATLAESSSPANYHKIPATVAFSADDSGGVHYAAESLEDGTRAAARLAMAY